TIPAVIAPTPLPATGMNVTSTANVVDSVPLSKLAPVAGDAIVADGVCRVTVAIAAVPELPALSVQPGATPIVSAPSVSPAVDENVKRHVFVPAIREAASDVSVVADCITVTSVAATLSTLWPGTGTNVTSTWKVAGASSAAPRAVPFAGLSIDAV